MTRNVDKKNLLLLIVLVIWQLISLRHIQHTPIITENKKTKMFQIKLPQRKSESITSNENSTHIIWKNKTDDIGKTTEALIQELPDIPLKISRLTIDIDKNHIQLELQKP